MDINIDGSVNMIIENKEIDVKTIEANCILKEMNKSSGFIYCSDSKKDTLVYNDEPVKVCYLGKN